jgi:ABC-2 type transport system permease protein
MLDQLLLKTRFAQFAFLPSYWLSASVLQLAEGAFQAAAFFALVLLSHVSFFGFLAFTRLGNTFYQTAAAAKGRASVLEQWPWFRRGELRRLARDGTPGTIEVLFSRLTFLGRDMRSLLLKDSRTFWRDTTQWGQTVMLFGLLGVYVINLRHFTHQLTSPFWINLVAYLNLGACSLNLATLTTRFVFPQFSLEGRRLWIVGMAPMGLARVVKTKYWLASFSSLLITLSLVTLSSYLLRMNWTRILFFSLVVSVMTFALNGLAVGLGVLYPNLKETSPSKIVSGFGGTLCLVLSFLYILGSVLLLGFGATGPHANRTWLILSLSGFCILSVGIGCLPLHLGLRRLRFFEY